jgi:hypothetical protein
MQQVTVKKFGIRSPVLAIASNILNGGFVPNRLSRWQGNDNVRSPWRKKYPLNQAVK